VRLADGLLRGARRVTVVISKRRHVASPQFVPLSPGRARPRYKIIKPPWDPHILYNCRHMPLMLLIQTSFGIPRPGYLRSKMRKVTAMRYRRDVLDVLSVIDQSTVDLSAFDTSVNVAADRK
jgi:hypothetical protein